VEGFPKEASPSRGYSSVSMPLLIGRIFLLSAEDTVEQIKFFLTWNSMSYEQTQTTIATYQERIRHVTGSDFNYFEVLFGVPNGIFVKEIEDEGELLGDDDVNVLPKQDALDFLEVVLSFLSEKKE